MDPETIMLPELSIRGDLMPSTWDPEKRTIDVVFATDAPVERRAFFDGPWMEVLGFAPGEMRASADGKVDVLYGHGLGEVDPRMASELKRPHIGITSNIRTEKRDGRTVGVATVRFSSRAEVADIVRDVAEGILTGISAGYRVEEYADMTKAGDAMKTRRATKWTLREISFLPLRADLAATVRAADAGCETPCRLIPSPTEPAGDTRTAITQATTRGATMTPEEIAKAEEQKRATDAAAAEQTRKLDEAREAGAKAERERVDSIRAELAGTGVDAAFGDELVRAGVSVAEAQKRILAKIRESSKGATQPATRITGEAIDHVRSGVQEALELRAGLITREKLTENGRRFAGMRMLRMAEEIERARFGKVEDYSADGIARRALSMATSDFPKITENVANKVLRKDYAAAAPTYRRIGRRSTASDFKPLSRVQMGLGTDLADLTEGGDVPYATMSESKESYKLGTFGRIVGLTRQMLVNDDARAFDRVPGILAGRAALKENIAAWALITGNVAMSDTVALFHSTHKNEMSPDTALGEAGLSAARTLMRKQTDPDGVTLNLSPKTLIVPAALETTGYKFVVAAVPNASSASNVSPFAGSMDLLVEPLLDAASGGATRWFIAAGSDQIDLLEYAFLDGRDGPTIEVFYDANFDGVKYRILHDFGVAPLDWRGFVRSNGTS